MMRKAGEMRKSEVQRRLVCVHVQVHSAAARAVHKVDRSMKGRVLALNELMF